MKTKILPPLLGVCAALFFQTQDLGAAGPRPNIVYILADDMGYGDPGFMGNKYLHTPNIDRLARGGTILSSYYEQPCCSPTRSTIMTGRYVMRTGVYSIVRPHARWGLPLAERTLAQALREAGYETAITGKWHLGEYEPDYLPTHRGFEHQYGNWFGAIDYFTHMRGKDLDWHRDDQICRDEGYSTFLDAKEACRIIRERKPDRPLFLYLPFNAVHTPLQAPPEYIKPYEHLSAQRRIYAGMVAAMDEAIGQVLAALAEKKMLDNTLIIFSSDNGGFAPGRVTDNGPLRAGKGTIYEGGVRICACVNWPGHIPAGKTTSEPLHSVDWFPTLVKLGGGSLDQKLPLDGKDIWPVLTEGAKSPHDEILLCGTRKNVTAIRVGDWKLLVNPNNKDVEDSGEIEAASGKIELYNLAADLGEKNDLAKTHPEKVKALRARLKALMKDAVPPGGGPSAAATKPPLMGWNSWNWFGRGITETDVKGVIDAMAANGMKEAGYNYIVVDGGWRDRTLGANGELRAHPTKFPGGIKALADYAHAKGFKFGLHTCPGTHDCAGDKVGGWGHEAVQVKQFAGWGVDFIKLDECFLKLGGGWTDDLVKETYPKWDKLLKESGRDIAFSLCT